MHRTRKKLTLASDTIRTLTTELSGVVAGEPVVTISAVICRSQRDSCGCQGTSTCRPVAHV